MQLFPLLVMDLFQNSAVQSSSSCAGREGLGILPLFMGQGWKLCSAAVRSPWPCCMSSSDEVCVWQEWLRDRPVLNSSKFLNRQEYFVLTFWSSYLIVQRNCLKESANTQDQQICSLCSWVSFPYYSAAEVLHDSRFAMLLTLLPTFVMHWCPAVLLDVCWTNVEIS